MPGSADPSSGSKVRAGSFVIRRSGDVYQFELDVPAAGGGLRPAIWSGTRQVTPRTRATIDEALQDATNSLYQSAEADPWRTETQVIVGPENALERVGRLIYQWILPEEIQEELSRY